MMDFDEQLKRESENLIEAQKEVVKRVAISAFSDAITRSPVGNPDLWLYKRADGSYGDFLAFSEPPRGYKGGRFRSSWFLSFNVPSEKVGTNITSEGSKKRSIAKRIMKDEKHFDYVLSNNLPYAEALEAGHSTQAPSGIVDPVIVSARRKLTKITKLVYKRRGIDE